MFTLAFDTSAASLSTAILDDRKILAKNTIWESGKQSELLIPEIEKILKSQKIWYQDLGLIAATNGPGSFTGTRIALTTARIIKAATNIPLIFVNCCEVAAFANRAHEGKIFVAIDAAMDELFIAEYFSQNQKLTIVVEPCLVKLEEVSQFLPKDNFLLCGSGKKMINGQENDAPIEADMVGLLAVEKFLSGEFSQNSDAIYLRAPRISERKK